MDKARLLERFSAQMRATARRYSANGFDADDAYQRAAEILLTREPTGGSDDLCRWLRTTVKHEALAIRAHHARVISAGEAERVPLRGPNPADTDLMVERRERLRLGARAFGGLKPQEARCLSLCAQGYSYAEIGELTGFSYTKINRCLTEGRAALRRAVRVGTAAG